MSTCEHHLNTLPSSAETLILGGGVAGLACRAALGSHHSNVLLDAAQSIGGLLRVDHRGPYCFDTVLHVIFFRSRRLLDGLGRLMPNGLRAMTRSHAIWQAGIVIPYPYQFNASALPAAVQADCLRGFRDNPHSTLGDQAGATFKDWLLAQFGPGFYTHFFQPYNEKLYGLPLDRLEAAPLRWTIPADNREAVLRGDGDSHLDQTTVYYPRGAGGISEISTALATLGTGPIVTDCRAVEIDLDRRIVRTHRDEEVSYRQLVSSLPLPELIRMVCGVPQAIRAMAEKLTAVSITVVRVGHSIAGPSLPYLWTYFPDPDVPWYRMTRLERISADLAPEGGSAILLECPGSTPPPKEAVVRWLDEQGVAPREALDHYETISVPYAYVLFEHGVRHAVRQLRKYLGTQHVSTIGRYGAWLYADIEMAIKSGFGAARRLRPDSGHKWPFPE
jgi:protoporphyrinogen oxidase